MNTKRDKKTQVDLASKIGNSFIDAHSSLCRECGEVIGYDTTFYIIGADKEPAYVHEYCTKK